MPRPRISNFSRAQRESDERAAERINDSRRQREAQNQRTDRINRRDDEGDHSADSALERLEARLSIEENSLEVCCTQHPDLLYQVTREVALQRSRRDASKKRLEERQATCYVQIRHDAAVSGDRITEAEIQARTTLDRECQRITAELLAQNEALARWEALREGYSQRSYMLRELVALYLANYYGGDPARSAENRMREMATEQVRQSHREQGPANWGRNRE